MTDHSSTTRKIVGFVGFALVLLLIFVLLALRAGWGIWDILKSLSGPAAMLTLAIFRGKMRREISDHLWIIATLRKVTTVVVEWLDRLRSRDELIQRRIPEHHPDSKELKHSELPRTAEAEAANNIRTGMVAEDSVRRSRPISEDGRYILERGIYRELDDNADEK